MNIYLKRMTYLCCIATFAQHSLATSNPKETSERVEESKITLGQITDSFDLSSQQPNFTNPAYSRESNINQVYIPNASVANFSSDDLVGLAIRYVQSKNDIPNPNGYTHSAFLFHANPMTLTQKISNLMRTKESELFKNPKYGAEMIYDIREYYPEIAGVNAKLLDNSVFCAESDGSAKEVLNGIYPHVHIHPFEQNVKTYNGEVSFRPCIVDISPARSLDVVLKYIGTPYENPFALSTMFKALKDKNKVEKSDRLFCSEFVGLAFRDLGVLSSDLIPDNVIPEELSAEAGKYDLLKKICGQDIKLKNTQRGLFSNFCRSLSSLVNYCRGDS